MRHLRGTMVLLRHTLPDGSWHLDLMLAEGDPPPAGSPQAETRDVITFRVEPRGSTAALPGTPFDAERLADHRRLYLDHEGAVSYNRGEVRRLDRRSCRIIEQPHDAWLVELAAASSDGARAWVVKHTDDRYWRFTPVQKPK